MLNDRDEIFEALRKREITIRAAVLMLMQLKLSTEIQKELYNEHPSRNSD